MSSIGPTSIIGAMNAQLKAVIDRHQQGGDTVALTIAQGVVVAGLREYSMDQSDPELGYNRGNKTCQVRFSAAELNGAQLGQDFKIGDQVWIEGPIVQPGFENVNQDKSRWELQYYRESADALLITVGLKSND